MSENDLGQEIPDFTGTRRYVVRRRIGKGGMGSVYEARDTLLNTDVAIKTLDRGSSPDVLFFKREFRSIAEIRHPNLVRLFDLKLDDERWFFTMELVEGLPLTEYLKVADMAWAVPDGVLRPPCCDIEKLSPLVAQLLDALEVLHHHGIVHRDLKPDNILVTPCGTIKLLDFGIALPLSEPSLNDRVMGTATYMSPEQTRRGEITPASDLYSLGVVLFELITGVRPFVGSQFELLSAHRFKSPPRIETLTRKLPGRYIEVCNRLLSKTPPERPTIDSLRETLGLERGSTRLARLERETAFVGRDSEVRALSAHMKRARGRQLQLVLIEGASGSGKSTLARACLRVARGDGFLTFEGRCYEREDVPYRAFDRLMDQVAVHLSTWEPETLEAWREALADAARLFSVFRVPLEKIDAPWTPSVPEGDPVSWRRRAMNGIASVITAMCLKSPVLFVLDNLHWSDTEDLQLLQDLKRLCARCPLMIVTTWRELGQKNRDFERFIKSFEDGQNIGRISLGPMGEEEICALVSAAIDDPRGTAQLGPLVMEQTGGNPFFAAQMMFMLREDQRRADPQGLPDLKGLVRWRLGRLNSEERRLVELASVAGGALRHSIFQETSSMQPKVFNHTLDKLLGAHLVRATSADPGTTNEGELQYDLCHDRFGEIAYGDLQTHRRQQFHGSWALTLERRLGSLEEGSSRASVLEALYRHWVGAGQQSRAWRYGLQAAEEAARCLAFEHAARLYQTLLSDEEGKRHEVDGVALTSLREARLWEQLARMREYAGDYAGACRALERALLRLSDEDGGPPRAIPPGTSEGDDERAACVRRLYLWLADDLLKTGQLKDGEQIFERLLAPLGLKLRHPNLENMGRLARLRIVAVGSHVVPESRRRKPTGMDLFQLDLFRKIFESFALVRPHYMAEYLLRFQSLARRINDPAAQAYDLAYEGIFVSMTSRNPSRFERSRGLLEEAQTLFDQTRLPFAPAYTLGFRGLIYWMEGRWHDAQAILEEALTFATEHQYTHLWESFMVRAWLLRTCHYLGDHTRAAELADDMRTEAGQGDIVRFGQAAWVSACRLLQQGSFEEADALIERWRPRVPSEPNHQRVLLEVAQLHSDLDQGRLEGVAQRVLSSTQELAEAGCLYSPWHEFLYYIPALEVVAALESGSGRVDKRSKSALLKMVKQVQRQGAPFMSCMAHRAQALLAHAEGKTREARTQTLKALALSATANTPYHRYLCLDTATMLGIGGEELSEEMAELALRHSYRVRT